MFGDCEKEVKGVALNESPSEKEGKLPRHAVRVGATSTLNESPSEKEGKYIDAVIAALADEALNESPSEKEGKSDCLFAS